MVDRAILFTPGPTAWVDNLGDFVLIMAIGVGWLNDGFPGRGDEAYDVFPRSLDSWARCYSRLDFSANESAVQVSQCI
jgi:hypothetical protein